MKTINGIGVELPTFEKLLHQREGQKVFSIERRGKPVTLTIEFH